MRIPRQPSPCRDPHPLPATVGHATTTAYGFRRTSRLSDFLRETHRPFPTRMSAVPCRTHGGSQNVATIHLLAEVHRHLVNTPERVFALPSITPFHRVLGPLCAISRLAGSTASAADGSTVYDTGLRHPTSIHAATYRSNTERAALCRPLFPIITHRPSIQCP